MRSRPFLTLVPFLLFATGARASLTVIVTDQDTRAPVSITVILVRIGPPQQTIDLGATDGGRVTNQLATCALGDTIVLQPMDSNYAAPTDPVACDKSVIPIPLRSLSRVDHIKSITDKAELKNEFGKAAQAANELYASQPNPDTEKRIYVDTARALGLSPDAATVTDPQQHKVVASPALVDSVKRFQTENALKPSGIINGETLAAMGNGSTARNVLFERSM